MRLTLASLLSLIVVLAVTLCPSDSRLQQQKQFRPAISSLNGPSNQQIVCANDTANETLSFGELAVLHVNVVPSMSPAQVQCAWRCTQHDPCHSFSFWPAIQTCLFYFFEPIIYQQQPGCIYYERRDLPSHRNDINECNSNPCQNGATCLDQLNLFTCTCAPGYNGVSCQTDINECASNPCQNGASCLNMVNQYTCTCVAGYAGVNCQTEIDECVSQPCQHGATCNNLINRFTCSCALGYTGVLCQTDINECASAPCVNGATCVNNIGYYACTCRAGYLGTNCQTDMNCSTSPAQYNLVVYTGGDPTAGTDAKVYAQLYGTAGSGTEKWLNGSYNLFQPGAGDSFTVYESYALNRLTRIHVRMDDTGVSAAWNINRIVVYDVSCGGVYTFYGNGAWLGGGYGTDTYLYP